MLGVSIKLDFSKEKNIIAVIKIKQVRENANKAAHIKGCI